ncbi:twin-arginine translocation pathway signal [Luminiphilus syltensis NOR5-1B]|uniref:Twin-arginine translocation pathway signal n=1 Tax=Luminiphilus syltensis NOR5-1B TaxID=565045 RepID=B8KVE9_9GAMM|nr:FAD/NAD(P)-binding protein [Luminiphilus syltensis]EED34295.1 twin-arginine translocation pathway signal [Luminiphilus syltensis NOR5-1B]
MSPKQPKSHKRNGISRRDFLNGVSIAIGGSMLGMGRSDLTYAGAGAYYPPALTGMRGSHPGSFEVAHGVVKGKHWEGGRSDEQFDLIIVGAGISGLSAAYFYRRDVDPDARILILDNHDDFGGHAKRNEFSLDGETLIGFGGTMLVESPRGYPQVARDLIQELGVTYDTDEAFNHFDRFREMGLTSGYFLDKETFGADRVIVDDLSVPEALAAMPLSDRAKADIRRLFADKITYLDSQTTAERKWILETLSYRDYLKQYAGMGEEALAIIQKRPEGVWAIGADACPAWLAWDSGYPGFGDIDLGELTIAGTGGHSDSDRVRFPDGNATIARLLVTRLVPETTPARSVDDVVTAVFDYSVLDQPANPTCIRLNSTVVRTAHRGGDLNAPVDVTYVKNGKATTVAATKVIWAGYHAMLPYVCPDLTPQQTALLSTSVRAPLVYVSVLLKNWRAIAESQAWRLNCPGSFFQYAMLTHPVSYGDYRYAQTPDDPVILHMQHIPLAPGEPAADQFRIGRARLLETPFSTFEDNIREQCGRMYGPAGFDPDRDIGGITVNRWSHGYAYSTHPETGEVAWYPEHWEGGKPWVEGRGSIGNIAIAGTDAASNAMTEAAIEQAHRAVSGMTER